MFCVPTWYIVLLQLTILQRPVLDTGEWTISRVGDGREAAVVVGVGEQSSERESPHAEAHRRLDEEGAVLRRPAQHCVALQEAMAFVYQRTSPCHQHGRGVVWGYSDIDRRA